VENAGFGATWAGPIGGLLMEKYLNDTLTAESKTKTEYLANVDLMPQSIKDWYVRNNKTERLTPIEYNNDELGDVWDMEMVSENTPKPQKPRDTIQKAVDSNLNKTSSIPPAKNPVLIKKDSAALINKKKKKHINPKNVNHT